MPSHSLHSLEHCTSGNTCSHPLWSTLRRQQGHYNSVFDRNCNVIVMFGKFLHITYPLPLYVRAMEKNT